MTYRIATALIERIFAEAAASPEREVCGLLLGRGRVIEEVRACRNVAADPACRFEIDPAALIAAHRAGRGGGASPIGCYHSHPFGPAEPSPRDAADAEANGWLWLIVAGGVVNGFRAVADGMLHGRFDPVTLLD